MKKKSQVATLDAEKTDYKNACKMQVIIARNAFIRFTHAYLSIDTEHLDEPCGNSLNQSFHIYFIMLANLWINNPDLFNEEENKLLAPVAFIFQLFEKGVELTGKMSDILNEQVTNLYTYYIDNGFDDENSYLRCIPN